VLALTFRGSRAELDRAAALRLQAAIVLLFLAVRCVHLGQAGVDLALAGRAYTVQWLAFVLGATCVAESVLVAVLTLGARRLTRTAILVDAAFGFVGLALMAVATSAGPGRAGSLNWMLPYTVATATGLGVLAGGELVSGPKPAVDGPVPAASVAERRWRDSPIVRALWPLALALALAGAFLASAQLPHRLAYDSTGQIWGDAANYVVFFAAGALTLWVGRRGVARLSNRNAEAVAAAAELAREAQWRAVAVDVLGPALALLDRVGHLPDGEVPDPVRREAHRLIAMIDAVRPGDGNGSSGEHLGDMEALAR
jgi:hypothetical protein